MVVTSLCDRRFSQGNPRMFEQFDEGASVTRVGVERATGIDFDLVRD